MGIFESAFTILSTIAALAAVLLLAYISLKWMGQKLPSQNETRHIKVVDRMVLGRDKYLLLVKVAEKTVLVGISNNSVDKICDIDDPDAVLEVPAVASKNFSDVLLSTIKSKGINMKDRLSKGNRGQEE